MSYQQTVNEIRSTATIINPNGKFDHGRIVDASQAFKGPFPMIFLHTFNMSLATGGDFIDDNNLIIGFWKKDNPASSTADREAIVQEMYLLAKQFFSLLQQNKLIKILGKIQAEPQYQMFNGTVSGVAARFTYQNFDPCE